MSQPSPWVLENLALWPKDMTLRCDDGDVGCHMPIIKLRCPVLWAIIDGRPEPEKCEYFMTGKSKKHVALIIDFLYAGVSKWVDTTYTMDAITIFQIADEFDIEALSKIILAHLLKWSGNVLRASEMYETCASIGALKHVADACMCAMIARAQGGIRGYRCAECRLCYLDSASMCRCGKRIMAAQVDLTKLSAETQKILLEKIFSA